MRGNNTFLHPRMTFTVFISVFHLRNGLVLTYFVHRVRMNIFCTTPNASAICSATFLNYRSYDTQPSTDRQPLSVSYCKAAQQMTLALGIVQNVFVVTR